MIFFWLVQSECPGDSLKTPDIATLQPTSTFTFTPLCNSLQWQTEWWLWTSGLEKWAQLLLTRQYVWESHHKKKKRKRGVALFPWVAVLDTFKHLVFLLMHSHITDSPVLCDSASGGFHATCECIPPPFAAPLNVNDQKHQKNIFVLCLVGF